MTQAPNGIDTPGLSPTFKAALWMTGTIVSFSSMAVAGREVSYALDTFEIMMYRSLIGLLIVAVVLSVTGRWQVVRHRLIGQHVIRNLAHFTGQNLWLFAVTAIPLAQVFALEFTSPLWVLILSPLLLGERLTRNRALCALAGFIGILIVARPSPSTLEIGLLAAASAALFFALTNILTKRLTRHETIGGIIFWLTALQLIMGIGAAGWDGDIALPGLAELPFVVVIALGGLTAHFCLTNALAIAPATVVMPFDFVRLPAIAVIGMLLYGEPLDIWIFVGGVVIFGAIYMNILAETRRNRVV